MNKFIFLSFLLLYISKIYLKEYNYAVFIPDNKETNVYTKEGALNGEKALVFLNKIEKYKLQDQKKLTKRISEEFFKKDTESNNLKNFTDFIWKYEKKDENIYVYKWTTPKTTFSEEFFYYIYQEKGGKRFGRTCLFNDLAKKDFDRIYVFEEKSLFLDKAKWNRDNDYAKGKLIFIQIDSMSKSKTESLIEKIIRSLNEF
ncbi:MAG: hypothetical protein SZ59_C0001G0111 [candidate division TM6 bacterium GW2011_GWF2_28_16]|nr:MAG: hypothetical protein SZ59_C0001G0111 [candidate division TM6 bacterium GW2011_GWF2_28_16]